MSKFAILAFATSAIFPLFSLPAWADTSAGESAQLLPLETRAMEASPDPERLKSVATEVNEAAFGAEEDTEDLFDLVNSPLLEGLVDEDGEINLPLGITVFSTLGDPSVGFGGRF